MESIIDIIKHFSSLMEKYAHLLFAHLAPSCSALFAAVFGCWFVWQLIYKGIFKSDLQVKDFLKHLLTCSIVHTLLQANLYFEWIYQPVVAVTMGFVQQIIAAMSKSTPIGEATIYGVIKLQYVELDNIFRMLTKMLGDFGLGNIKAPIAAILLEAPFIVLYLLLVCYSLNYMFSVMCITALSPLLIIYAGFKSTRPMAVNAMKQLTHATLTLACSVIVIGLSMYVLKSMIALMPMTKDGTIKNSAETFAFSYEYWKCFLLACFTVYLQRLCPNFANISGFSDGQGAAMLVSSFVAGSMAYVKAQSLKAGGKIGGKLGGFALGSLGWAGGYGAAAVKWAGSSAWQGAKSALAKAKTETPTD